MSAYVMDPQDIEAIGRFVQYHAVLCAPANSKGLWVYWPGIPYDENRMNGQQVAELLMAENVRSVNHRYKEADPAPAVRVPELVRIDQLPTLREVYELLGTWDYQACECDDYKQTRAYEALHMLRNLALDVATRM